MKINKISSKLIKPHTPTPQNLKNYKISFIDQLLVPVKFSVVLFYKSKAKNTSQLHDSLAKTLVEFYPLAGRYIKNDHLVDCNDEGVEFIEAEALDVELIDLVRKIEADQLSALIPEKHFRVDEAADDPLLSIQATNFRSGGSAIAVSVTHRVFDVASLCTFVAAWSNATNLGKTPSFSVAPTFDTPSLLPYKDVVFNHAPNEMIHVETAEEVVVRRLLFNGEALTRLRSEIRANTGKTVSAVRVVCAFIAKALISQHRRKSRDFVITQPINMRERTILNLPKHSCGNLIVMSLTQRIAASEAEEIGIQELVDVIGDGVRKSIAELASPNRDARDIIFDTVGNFLRELWNPNTYLMCFTDFSRFGFYEADFGWGKPVWTSIGPQTPPTARGTVLMSNEEGDGIEAWVHLNQNDMRCFEQNDEIKYFMA